jgi:hypothetical protein
MIGNTTIILTADHGNQDNPPTLSNGQPDRYQVPFFVWGPGVPAGEDLYALNNNTRKVATSYPMTTYGGLQPIRNAEVNNLALDLLGLGAIPGSMFNSTQDLVVTVPGVTLGMTGSPLAEAAGVATVTATLSAAHSQAVTVNLAFSGTATLAADYTRSDTGIVIPAGSTSGSITLTAVQDSLYEVTPETIVVDVASVVNGMESGTQQVTATIAEDDTGFTSWIAGFTWSDFTNPDKTPAGDPDGDGLLNGVEYVLGSSPAAANQGGPSGSTLGSDFIFTFQRAIASKTADTAVTIEVGTTLAAWPDVYVAGPDTDSSTPGVTVTPGPTGYELITLTIDRAPDATKLARMRVTVTP